MEQDTGCAAMMQLIAGARGAIDGLMAELVEDHVRMHVVPPDAAPGTERSQSAEELIDVLRAYLK